MRLKPPHHSMNRNVRPADDLYYQPRSAVRTIRGAFAVNCLFGPKVCHLLLIRPSSHFHLGRGIYAWSLGCYTSFQAKIIARPASSLVCRSFAPDQHGLLHPGTISKEPALWETYKACTTCHNQPAASTSVPASTTSKATVSAQGSGTDRSF